MGWWSRLVAWVRKMLGRTAESPSGAAAALADIRAEREALPAVSASDVMKFGRMQGQLQSAVFSAADRERVWRRAARRSERTVRALALVQTPTPDELAVMRVLIDDLERGR
jgi:hypothetical protein